MKRGKIYQFFAGRMGGSMLTRGNLLEIEVQDSVDQRGRNKY